MPNILLVGNPTAQSGRANKRITNARAQMEARGWPVEFISTLPDGQTVDLIAAYMDAHPELEIVVSMGGDGTFSEVAKGVIAAKEARPLGMLPSGTANDQGKSFGISSREDQLHWNLDVIAAMHTHGLDVGKLGRVGVDGKINASEYVFHSVGWGLQSEVLEQRNEDRASIAHMPLLRLLYRDQAVYAGATLKTLLRSYVEPIKFSALVRVDGQEYSLDRLSDLVLNATPVYGGNWVPDRSALSDDGLFELVPIRGRREWASRALLDLRNSPFREEHFAAFGVDHSDSVPGREFDVQLLRPRGQERFSTQVDGEEWVEGVHFKLSVLPRLLQVVVPAEFEPPWR